MISGCSGTNSVPRLADACPADGHYRILSFPKDCGNAPYVAAVGGLKTTTIDVSPDGTFTLPALPDGSYSLTLSCNTSYQLGSVQVPCAAPPDLSAAPDLSTENPLPDLLAAPDLSVPPKVRASFAITVDLTPSPSPNPSPAPGGLSFMGFFFDSTETPAAESAIQMLAADPFGYEAIPDDTCAGVPVPSPIPNLPMPVAAGDSVALRAGANTLLTANPTPSPPAYLGGNSTVASPLLINPGIDVFVIDHLNAADLKVGTLTALSFPNELKQPIKTK